MFNGSARTASSGQGNPQPIVATSTPVKSVIIQADSRNIGPVTIGGPTTNASTFSGTEFNPGDSATLAINDLAAVFIDGLSQQRIMYTAVA